MKLLHLDASILANNSVSRQLSAAVVKQLTSTARDSIDVIYRDLTVAPLAHLSSAHLAAAQGAVPESPEVREDIASSVAVLEEFLSAEILVLGSPMYNFTVPSQLKAWIDRILIAGRTFRYTAQGVEGLAGNKRVILALARGGIYSEGSPAAPAEHVETYLRAVFGFIGITRLDAIVAEGVQLGPEPRQLAVSKALAATAQLSQ